MTFLDQGRLDEIAALRMARNDDLALSNARVEIRRMHIELAAFMRLTPELATPELLAYAARFDALCMARLAGLERLLEKT